MRQLKITQRVTNRDTPALEKYLADISPIGLVDGEREAVLAERIQRGDQSAHDELVEANLRFVVSVAKQYQGQGMTLSDLISTGNLGLIKAAGRFDHTKGFKFISYAVWWIRQMILQALSDQGRVVRLPLNKISTINKIKKATATLEQMYERAPSMYEISEHLDVSVSEVDLCIRSNQTAKSINQPLSEDRDSNTMEDILPNTEGLRTDLPMDIESMNNDIEMLMTLLTPREKSIIYMFYGIGYPHALSLMEISDKLEISRERVRQIREKAIRRLRTKSVTQNLKEHLG